MKMSYLLLLAALFSSRCDVEGFVQPAAFFKHCKTFSTALNDGYGIATNYSWTEEAFEMEVTVSVPKDTRAKDIAFKATPTSIDLRLKGQEVPLLDGARKMRGRISIDGTYWVISDSETNSKDREVTVTVEKHLRTPNDDFEIVDYDWRGVYPEDDEEVSERKYEEPEELNVREYAASLGVDIDNINMSMVDKTMFSGGLNLTRSTMDELTKSGYVQEVTQQSDGTEYVTSKNGTAVPFSRLGDTVEGEELRKATDASTTKIPLVDTTSPVPADDKNAPTDEEEARLPDRRIASDPIDLLTVKRLREILRAEGLKVSGSKRELQDRLRQHVGAIAEEVDKTKSFEQ